MVKPQRKSIDLSLKSVFLDVEEPFAACNVCPVSIQEIFGQTQGSDYWQLIHWKPILNVRWIVYNQNLSKACESSFSKWTTTFKTKYAWHQKKNLKAHAISCGHAKFCCVTMSNILREKTLKQLESVRDKSEEVKRHEWKNVQSLMVTVLCLL